MVSWPLWSSTGFLLASLVVGCLAGPQAGLAQSPPLTGSVDKTVSGPAGKGSARFQGTRAVTGNTATSQGTVTGSQGRTITGTGSSQIEGNTVTSEGTITGPRGQATQLQGSATKQGNTVTGTGTATGPGGQTVTGTGEVSKTGETVSGTGTATGPQGKAVTVSGSGSQSAGSATVEAPRGTSTTTWDADSVTTTGPRGQSQTAVRGSRARR
jgi:hypothetical protein